MHFHEAGYELLIPLFLITSSGQYCTLLYLALKTMEVTLWTAITRQVNVSRHTQTCTYPLCISLITPCNLSVCFVVTISTRVSPVYWLNTALTHDALYWDDQYGSPRPSWLHGMIIRQSIIVIQLFAQTREHSEIYRHPMATLYSI